jgi:hypothetical protein
MGKFKIVTTLKDDRYCDGCRFFVGYEPYQIGGFCVIEGIEVEAGDVNILRPLWCPLVQEI